MFTIPIPNELIPEARESLKKIIPMTEIDESRALLLAEKIGL